MLLIFLLRNHPKMKRLSKVQEAIKYFTKDGIKISADKKYFSVNSISMKYFNLTEKDFVAAYHEFVTVTKGRNSIAPSKLLKCLEKTDSGRAIINKINGDVSDETKKIIDEATEKSKKIIKAVTVENMVHDISFRQKDEEKSIRYGKTTIIKITEDEPLLFYYMTGCPKNTITILKNLNVPIYKVSSCEEYVISYDHCEKIFENDSQNSTRVYKSDDGSVFIYSIINEDLINNVMKVTASNALTYSFQRQVAQTNPDRFNKINDVPDPKKRTEFETLHYLYLKLSPDFIFKYQVKVGSYSVDCVIIPKGSDGGNMIDISVEIEIPCGEHRMESAVESSYAFHPHEDGHKDRDPVKEIQREKFIRAAGFEVYRIPVKRDLPSESIRKIVDEESDKIIKMIKKKFVFNSPELILKMIKEYVIENNVHNDFISLFFRETTPGNPFVYAHQDIGAYLGFSKDENYRGLVELIKTCCTEDVDYVVINRDGKHYYNLTRLGFNYVCSSAKTELAAKISRVFAKVYELTTQLTVILTSGVPDSMKLNAKDRSCVIESEILKHKADNSVFTELQRNNDDLKNRLSDVTDALNILQIENSKLNKKITVLLEEIEELKADNIILRTRNDKLNKRVQELQENDTRLTNTVQEANKRIVELENMLAKLKPSKKNNSKSSYKKVIKKS